MSRLPTIRFIAFIVALGLTAVWLLVWWSAMQERWVVTLAFNDVGEAWLEGVLLHLCGLLFLALAIAEYRGIWSRK